MYDRCTSGATKLQALANEWERGFFQELDYRKEAENTIRFNQGMQARNINAVCAPVVLLGYSTEQILVTEWVDGTRRSKRRSGRAPPLFGRVDASVRSR